MLSILEYIKVSYHKARDEGMTNNQIAQCLGITERSLYNYRNRGLL